MREYILRLKDIKKSFGETEVLKQFALDVEKGQFVTILGSSGCGKTTLLRIIAGLEQLDAGHVYLEGQDVTDLEPNHRPVNMVFQNYALFPHMDVAHNIGYALKLQKKSKAEIASKVDGALKLVQLDGYGTRLPSELSGGQRQRVAIARALVAEPKVLLLDEPLGALDLQLRRMMQQELKALQKKLGITFVYITHDQEEAINMSDVIVVMKDGKIEQQGTPNDIYYHPVNAFVASFVGNANVLEGVREVEDNQVFLRIGDVRLAVGETNVANPDGKCRSDCETEAQADSKVTQEVAQKLNQNTEHIAGQNLQIALRTENIELSTEGTGFPAVITSKSFVGGLLRMTLKLQVDSEQDEALKAQEVEVSSHGIDSEYREGDIVYLSWKQENAVILHA